MQTLNIAAGVIAAAPMIKRALSTDLAKQFTSLQEKLNIHYCGAFMAAIGAIGLLERANIIDTHFTGASYPQAIAAILVGLALAPHLLRKIPAVHAHTKKAALHAEWIGLIAIAIGAGSLLFGCVAPICYPMY